MTLKIAQQLKALESQLRYDGEQLEKNYIEQGKLKPLYRRYIQLEQEAKTVELRMAGAKMLLREVKKGTT